MSTNPCVVLEGNQKETTHKWRSAILIQLRVSELGGSSFNGCRGGVEYILAGLLCSWSSQLSVAQAQLAALRCGHRSLPMLHIRHQTPTLGAVQDIAVAVVLQWVKGCPLKSWPQLSTVFSEPHSQLGKSVRFVPSNAAKAEVHFTWHCRCKKASAKHENMLIQFQ